MTDFHGSEIIDRYGNKGIVVDSILVLVILLGHFDPKRIRSFKRTRDFSEYDFDLLDPLLEKFRSRLTTPQILSEVNSLSNQLVNREKDKFYSIFTSFISDCDERYIPSKEASTNPSFNKFGLTDSTMVKLAEEGFLVLTKDFPLVGYLEKRKLPVLNYNHIRPL